MSAGATLGLALAANLITHPLLWALVAGLDETAHLVLAEIGVAVLEGLMIFAVVQRRRVGEDPGRAAGLVPALRGRE